MREYAWGTQCTIIKVRMCDVETMSLVGYKIGYIVNFASNPDCHLDFKWRSRNRGWWDGLKKTLVQSSRGERYWSNAEMRWVQLLLIATCSKKNEHSFPCLYCYWQYERDVRVADATRTRATIQRSCACRMDDSQTVTKWRQLGRQIFVGQQVRTGYVMARRICLCGFVTSLKQCLTMVDLSIYSMVTCCICVYL